MTAAVVPAALQNIDEAFEVGIDIGVRMVDRMTHAGLGREVDYDLETVLREQRRHCRTIGKVGLHETESRVLAQDVQP